MELANWLMFWAAVITNFFWFIVVLNLLNA